MHVDYSKPVCIEVVAHFVRVWFDSPTGGVSDSQVFLVTCESPEQAEMVAQQWADTHQMVWYDRHNRAVDARTTVRLGSEVL